MKRRAASLAAASILMAGCYRYAAVSDGSPAAGADVRLALGGGAPPELFRVLGEGTRAVEGRITSASDSAYAVRVRGTRKQGQAELTAWDGEQVIIPRRAVAGIERRTLDRKRTFGIAGIAILAAAGTKLLIDGFGTKSGGNDGGGTTPPTP
ncbi:MAG TPA: hypothetical protein VM076_11980 [Gemmatimonadaceae bacterium]|nr:hypothetical protein [Gemmatimonadaceae bacterium]